MHFRIFQNSIRIIFLHDFVFNSHVLDWKRVDHVLCKFVNLSQRNTVFEPILRFWCCLFFVWPCCCTLRFFLYVLPCALSYCCVLWNLFSIVIASLGKGGGSYFDFVRFLACIPFLIVCLLCVCLLFSFVLLVAYFLWLCLFHVSSSILFCFFFQRKNIRI